ncbi:hypothetical protein SynNOUM97013_01175 [Synechococcus sp. NOUM97013]|nr:hypothetical protein SynNOUM97013_01175 [Synechococcus sp. NOUM97013]
MQCALIALQCLISVPSVLVMDLAQPLGAIACSPSPGLRAG